MENTAGIINLTAENIALLKAYKQESFAAYADLETAKQQLKDIVEAASDKTGLEKRVINKFFKLCYSAKAQEYLEEAAVIEALNN